MQRIRLPVLYILRPTVIGNSNIKCNTLFFETTKTQNVVASTSFGRAKPPLG